uniref:DNA helicase n=1 Tax=Cacopsylla melanoneura TaxID=428564 RepID=A0A8D8VN64_9HEMI
MKPAKNKVSGKTQPKISNFLVPSDPFSNKSPSKQLKISDFFNKAANKSSQEENISCNSAVRIVSSSPECVPGTPELGKKRKRSEESCKRKLMKIDNYNKLLYEQNDDDCQIIESTSSTIQTNLKLKESTHISDVKKVPQTKPLQTNQSQSKHFSENVLKSTEICNVEQNQPNILKNKTENSDKFSSRSEKILSKVSKREDDGFYSSNSKVTNKGELTTKNKQKREPTCQKTRQHVGPKSISTEKTVEISKKVIEEHVEKSNIDTNVCLTKSTMDQTSTLQPPSVLSNDNLLDELLGELDTKTIVNISKKSKQPQEKDEVEEEIRKKNDISEQCQRIDKTKEVNDNGSVKNNCVSELNKFPLVEIDENILMAKEGKNTAFSYSSKKECVSNSINIHEENNERSCDQDSKQFGTSNDTEKNILTAVLPVIESNCLGSQQKSTESKKIIQDLKINNLSRVPNRTVQVSKPNEKSEESNKKIQGSKLKTNQTDSNADSVSSFLQLYGVRMPTDKPVDTLEPAIKTRALLTPEKSVKLETCTASVNAPPLTPEKPAEASVISQEVAKVLSCTKSPRISTPDKTLAVDLSEISKINFDDCDEEEWDFSQIDCIEKLDLSSFQKCEVINIETISGYQLKLHLKQCEAPGTSTWCLVQGSWVHTQLAVQDIINIKAVYSVESGAWVVDNTRGLIVYAPDMLISGTSVVGALFCMRKSILADLFKGIDSGSSIMVLGILLHQFLQEVLRNNLRTESELRTVIQSMISSQDTILMMYSSLMSLEDTQKELTSFIPRIQNFLACYVDGGKPASKPAWDGKILRVEDIEENIWLPNLGIKGKVDVTVKVKSRNVVKTLPLELKTGRASRSAEHRGQVILYAMMMSEMEDKQQVESGLLLYLRENILDEVRSGHPEKRDLLMLRNQLVYYFNQDVASVNVPFLPPPINHHSACSKCPYLYICSAALREEGLDRLPDDNPLKGINTEATSHLTEKHIRYVFHMTALVRMEFQAARQKSKQLSDVWTLDPETREQRGDCICNLSLDPGVQCVKARYQCSLSRSFSIPPLIFSLSQYVIVSSSTQPAVASGFVTGISECALTLSLDRDLSTLSAGGARFHVDTYESQSLMSFNLIGLGLLLEKDHRNNSMLRSLIIDLTLPRFSRKHHASILDTGADLLSKLNSGQKKAVLKVLTAKDYLLIKGMPGTGKSSTLACLIELLVRLKLTVLVTSHTHSAVDNLLMRLIDKVPFLRLGSLSRVHPSIVPFCDAVCTKHCTSPEQLADFYKSKPVIGVTCMGSVHPLLQKVTFDVCIVDEATQVLLPATLPPLLSAGKFILVGDPQQLSPLVISKRASELGLSESLFSRLDRPEVTTLLTAQYRMNQPITRLVNLFTYGGQLECANETVERATIPQLMNFSTDQAWLQKCVSNQLESSVIFLNVCCDNANEATNQNEAGVVKTLVTGFTQGGIASTDIGVIATYRNQVSLLRRMIDDNQVEVNTVDQYQGRDKSVILYSSTCSKQNKESKVLNDPKRLTVAISRSKHKLIILGDSTVIEQTHKVFNKLIDHIRECGTVLNVT